MEYGIHIHDMDMDDIHNIDEVHMYLLKIWIQIR